jgi:alpha-1,6-mannosyltransferase
MPAVSYYRKESGRFLALLACFVLTFLALFSLNDLRIHATLFLALYLLSFGVYGFLCYQTSRMSVLPTRAILVAVAVISIGLLTTHTNISTDVYRYVWDGGLTVHRINPYLVTPLQVSPSIFKDSGLYSMLDWKDQFTVYPPFAELIFAVSYLLYLSAGIVGVKALFALPLVGIWLLMRRLVSHRLLVLLILNPLLLFEAFNGAHIDITAVFLTVLSWYFYTRKNYVYSSIALAGAVLTKLFPIIFLPLFFIHFYRAGMRWVALMYVAVCGSIVTFAYLPLVSHIGFLVSRYGSWIRDMQFNAGGYALIKATLNIMTLDPAYAGVLSATLLLVGIVLISRSRVRPTSIVLSALLFLFLSSVVYPWYTVIIVPFIFLMIQETRMHRLLIPLVAMQFLVSATYFNQIQTIPYDERRVVMGVIEVVEYGTIAIILFVYRKYFTLSEAPQNLGTETTCLLVE